MPKEGTPVEATPTEATPKEKGWRLVAEVLPITLVLGVYGYVLAELNSSLKALDKAFNELRLEVTKSTDAIDRDMKVAQAEQASVNRSLKEKLDDLEKSRSAKSR